MTARHILASVMAVCAGLLPVSAQDLSGEVTVKGQYIPTLRSHSRISSLPAVPKLTLPTSSLNVEYKGVPTLQSTSLAPMSAAGWNDTKQFSDYRGYLELEGGSYLDFNGSLGYRFVDNDKMTLGAWLQHLSTTGFKPASDEPGVKAHAAKRFDENLGFYGTYNVDKVGVLDFDLRYHLGYFNYYSSFFKDIEGAPDPPTQTLQDIQARVGMRSANTGEGFIWQAELSDRYFGYREAYFPRFNFSPARENNLQLDGRIGYGFNAKNAIKLGLTANYVGYTSADMPYPLWVHDSEYTGKISGYGRLALNPAYTFSGGDLTARLGFRLDINSSVGKKGQMLVRGEDEFGNVHIAPDVALGFRKGKLGIDLSVSGGTELRTLADGSELFYYQSPQLVTTVPLYSPLNASLRLNANGFLGLSGYVGVAYKITDNTTPDLLYPEVVAGNMTKADALYFYLLDVKGVSLQAGASYKYGDIVAVNADLSYQPQSGSTGYYNGPDRPRWIIGVNADVNPWSTLHFTAGYQYRGVRNVWYQALPIPLYGATEPAASYDDLFTDKVRLNDVTDLSVGASYTFNRRFTLRLNASNLLGTNYLLAPGMPSEGVRVTGGFSVLF